MASLILKDHGLPCSGVLLVKRWAEPNPARTLCNSNPFIIFYCMGLQYVGLNASKVWLFIHSSTNYISFL